MNTFDEPEDPDFTPAPRIESRSRDALGRFIHEQPVPEHPDESLCAEEVILGLRNLWFHGKTGSKAALARATGFQDRRQLSAVLRAKAPLHEPIRRRCSRFLTQVRSGQMKLISTGYARSGYPTFEWRREGIGGNGSLAWGTRARNLRTRYALDRRF